MLTIMMASLLGNWKTITKTRKRLWKNSKNVAIHKILKEDEKYLRSIKNAPCTPKPKPGWSSIESRALCHLADIGIIRFQTWYESWSQVVWWPVSHTLLGIRRSQWKLLLLSGSSCLPPPPKSKSSTSTKREPKQLKGQLSKSSLTAK